MIYTDGTPTIVSRGVLPPNTYTLDQVATMARARGENELAERAIFHAQNKRNARYIRALA